MEWRRKTLVYEKIRHCISVPKSRIFVLREQIRSIKFRWTTILMKKRQELIAQAVLLGLTMAILTITYNTAEKAGLIQELWQKLQ